jgi:hypothetical protein
MKNKAVQSLKDVWMAGARAGVEVAYEIMMRQLARTRAEILGLHITDKPTKKKGKAYGPTKRR